MGSVVLVIGGARSGKTAFALRRASEVSAGGGKLYIATAQPLDAEMEERIDKHRKERGSLWETCEEPIHPGHAVKAASRTHAVAVIDCLTLWLSNLLCGNMDIERARSELVDSLQDLGECHLFIVSNEVGLGLVPENEMARRFRDEQGRLNQRVAECADEVYLMAAGIPVRIK